MLAVKVVVVVGQQGRQRQRSMQQEQHKSAMSEGDKELQRCLQGDPMTQKLMLQQSR